MHERLVAGVKPYRDEVMNNNRRNVLKGLALSGVSASLGMHASSSAAGAAMQMETNKLKGNIHHSVSRWTYGNLSIEALCLLVKKIGFSAIDLVGPEDWPMLKKHGVDSSMCNGAELGLEDGFIHTELHDELEKRYLEHIDLVAEAGYKNLICFSGNARGMTTELGLSNDHRTGLE